MLRLDIFGLQRPDLDVTAWLQALCVRMFNNGPFRNDARREGSTSPLDDSFKQGPCNFALKEIGMPEEWREFFGAVDVPDFLGPLVSGKMALDPRGRADEEEPIH